MIAFVFIGRYHIWAIGEQCGGWDHTVTMLSGGPLKRLL